MRTIILFETTGADINEKGFGSQI